MGARDGGLQREASRRPYPKPVDRVAETFENHPLVPAPAVLGLQQHEAAGLVEPGRAPRMGEQQQAQQAAGLGLGRQQGHERAGEVEGPVAQVVPDELVAGGRRVPRAEEQVHAC